MEQKTPGVQQSVSIISSILCLPSMVVHEASHFVVITLSGAVVTSANNDQKGTNMKYEFHPSIDDESKEKRRGCINLSGPLGNFISGLISFGVATDIVMSNSTNELFTGGDFLDGESFLAFKAGLLILYGLTVVKSEILNYKPEEPDSDWR